MPSKTVFQHPASDGLTLLLYPSEAEVMRIVWARGPLKVRAIHAAIKARRDIAYTTVMTTCLRLAEKGLLHREKVVEGAGYIYTATIGEQEFVRRELASILDHITRDYPHALDDYLATRRAQLPAAPVATENHSDVQGDSPPGVATLPGIALEG